MKYLLDKLNNVLIVTATISNKKLIADFLYVHPASDRIIDVFAPSVEVFKVNISNYLKSTPTYYTGEVELDVF